MAHSDLILDRSPLQETNADIDCLDQHSRNRYPQSVLLLRISIGFGLLAVGFVAFFPVADALCEGRIGVLQIMGIVFFIIAFSAGELLLIWNLARLIAQKG